MKIKNGVWIAALILLFSQSETFAQYSAYNGKRPIVVDEDAIRHITVSGNVDVVIRTNSKPGTVVKVEDKATAKIEAYVAGADLFISSAKSAGANERFIVYVWTDELQTLTLNGNTYAVSIGILDFKDLQVNMNDKSRVALRNTDKIRFNAKEDRPIVTNEKYYSVISSDR
jgi:hypothetical protein